MEARLLLVAALTTVVVPLASADIRVAGPYAADVVEVSACDDGEYPGIIVNISLVIDEETNQTTYRGDLTTTYDFFADDCEIQLIAFKWGSTGGWSQIYFLNYTEPFEFTKSTFPLVFDLLFNQLGIEEKPVPAGTYHMHSFMPRGITLEKFSALPYGKYKVYAKGLKDGEPLLCMQAICEVYEAEGPKGSELKSPF